VLEPDPDYVPPHPSGKPTEAIDTEGEKT
jgi:hypothetical protein